MQIIVNSCKPVSEDFYFAIWDTLEQNFLYRPVNDIFRMQIEMAVKELLSQYHPEFYAVFSEYNSTFNIWLEVRNGTT
jgi:hypothetical protein